MFKAKRSNNRIYNTLWLIFTSIISLLQFGIYITEGRIIKLAINECLIFSPKSLDLIECTNESISEIIKKISLSEKNLSSLSTCLKNPNYERTIIGLALSFGSGDNLEYNKIKCPRLIAALLRDRIFGYSCPYLSRYSWLFTFTDNKELRIKDFQGKKNMRVHPEDKEKSEIPTILTSMYTKLIQSCNKIELCLSNKKKLKNNVNNNLKSEPIIHERRVRDDLIRNYLSSLPKKIGRQDTFIYSNELLRRVTLEYEINVEKESPLDPFWVVQSYRMLFIYSVILNSSGIFVNLNSYHFKKVFNFLIDTKPLQNIDSLQSQSKYLGFDNNSKKQHLFLRASYAILESCFKFWDELHQYYISSLLTNNNKIKKNKLIDISQICQHGLQLSLRQTIIFFYYSGIKDIVKYVDQNILRDVDNNNEVSETVSSENNNIYVTCSNLTSDVPWFIESTNIFFPITTIEDLNGRRNREISVLINQSQPKINPKATVLNLNYNKLSGYFVGGNGSMMYKSCTYYLKKLHKEDSEQLNLPEVTKMSKMKDYKQVDSIEKIRYFCWYSAKESYPNDITFERENKYESKFEQDQFEISQYKNQNSSFNLTNSSIPKRIEYRDIKEISPKYARTQFSKHNINKNKKKSTFLDERRKEILQRLYPQNSDLDIKSLVYSVSDKLNDLKGVPVIRKHSANIQCNLDINNAAKLKKHREEKPKAQEESEKHQNLIPKLLQEIKFGVKLKPTGSSASNEILQNIRKEITSSKKNENLGISSSQIKNDMESTEFSPPIVETSLLDELSSNQKFLFEQ